MLQALGKRSEYAVQMVWAGWKFKRPLREIARVKHSSKNGTELQTGEKHYAEGANRRKLNTKINEIRKDRNYAPNSQFLNVGFRRSERRFKRQE